ncbi:hypothetical protein [Methylomonas rosea]|uniref:Uncharacterized protein n=1 Tax=Methylomonas rosea TaxID=2952227 RepID=A0ABT1TSH0_9GAMM|nr:hypothetical protein [Methylomonas sp. WSC-7]MCQ8117733.1 hypothetical protein [Methylomonas sp. WSC-7]
MSTDYPDLEWYIAISEVKSLTPRCPYVTIYKCPRYFDSIALISDTGITTSLDKSIHDKLLLKWKNHELFQPLEEMAASISDGKNINNFCPEVSFDIFGVFASSFYRFIDSIDKDSRHKQLDREEVKAEDWRWGWEYLKPIHYSQCFLYSKIMPEDKMTQINNFNAPVTGQVNIASDSIKSPILSGDINNGVAQEKIPSKSLLARFLSHPLINVFVRIFGYKIES